MVERIEGFDAELQRSFFCYKEFPPEGEIDLRHSKTAKGVSSQIALRGTGRGSKCSGVDTAATGRGRVVDPDRLAKSPIGPEYVLKAYSSVLLGVHHVDRKSRARVEHTIQRPSAARNLIGESGGERVADIEIGGSAILPRRQSGTRPVEACIGGTVVNGVGPRIRGKSLDSAR